MTVNEQHTADGVPVFTGAAEQRGPAELTIAVGVGSMHETPSQHGLTHMVEHAVLTPLSAERRDVNGFVGGKATLFSVVGSDDEVWAVAERILQRLADLTIADMAHERRVVLAETEQHRGDEVSLHARLRCGVSGRGSLLLPHVAVWDADLPTIRDWAATWSTTSNVAIAATVPPPPGFSTGLSSSRPPEMPAVSTIRTRGAGRFGRTSMSMTGPMTPAAGGAAVVLQGLARQTLRFEQGVVYDVDVPIINFAEDEAMLVLSVIGQDGGSPDVTEAMTSVLRRSMSPDVAATELEIATRHPMSMTPFDIAFAKMTEVVAGPTGMRDVEGRVRTDAGEIAEWITGAFERRIVLGPGEPDSDLPAIEQLSDEPSQSRIPKGGRTRKALSNGTQAGQRLHIVDGGVGVSHGQSGSALAIAREDLVLTAVDANDVWAFVGRNGDEVLVDPWAFDDPSDVIADLTAVASSGSLHRHPFPKRDDDGRPIRHAVQGVRSGQQLAIAAGAAATLFIVAITVAQWLFVRDNPGEGLQEAWGGTVFSAVLVATLLWMIRRHRAGQTRAEEV